MGHRAGGVGEGRGRSRMTSRVTSQVTSAVTSGGLEAGLWLQGGPLPQRRPWGRGWGRGYANRRRMRRGAGGGCPLSPQLRCPPSHGVPHPHGGVAVVASWPRWPRGQGVPCPHRPRCPHGRGVLCPRAGVSAWPGRPLSPPAMVSSWLWCPHGQGVPCPHARSQAMEGWGRSHIYSPCPQGAWGTHWGCCSGAAGETEAALGPMGTMVGVGGMGGGDSLGSLGMVQGGLGTSGRGGDISGGRRGQQEGGACWGHAGDVTMGWGEGVGCPGDIGDTPGGSKDVEDALGTGCGVWDGVAGATVGRVEGGPWGLGTVLGGWGSRGRVGDAGRGQMETLSVTQAGSR